MNLKIRESKYGMANRIGNFIILNKHLTNYPILKNHIMEHEIGHNTKDIVFDLRHDAEHLLNGKNMIKEYLRFMLRHPGSFLQASPIWLFEGRPYLDLSLLVLYIVCFSTMLIIYLGIKWLL